jgi:hypothetical protein
MEGLACNLNALTSEQRQERAELAKLSHAQTQELQELSISNGYAFRLPSSSTLFPRACRICPPRAALLPLLQIWVRARSR